jgi:hypothetical protein
MSRGRAGSACRPRASLEHILAIACNPCSQSQRVGQGRPSESVNDRHRPVQHGAGRLEAREGIEPVVRLQLGDGQVVRGGYVVAGSGHEGLVPAPSARAGVRRDDERAARAILVARGPAGVAAARTRRSRVSTVAAAILAETPALRDNEGDVLLPGGGRSP